jgi:hypothetical protein
MKKYEFIKVNEDTYKLKYKDKEFEIIRDVDIITKFQNVPNLARRRMLLDLAERGKGIGDLTIVRTTSDGKTIYDNRTEIEMEKTYSTEIQVEMLDNASKKYFGKSMVNVALDIGLETENEAIEFSKQFVRVLTGKYNNEVEEIPSDKAKEK